MLSPRWTSFYFVISIFLLFYFVLLLPKIGVHPTIIFVIALFFAASLPIIASLSYGFTYYLCLPSLYFGTWIPIIIFLEKYQILSEHIPLLSVVVTSVFITSVHLFTRLRAWLWRISMGSVSRIGMAALSIILLGLSLFILDPWEFDIPQTSRLLFFLALVLGYTFTSMLYINSNYRLAVLSSRLRVRNLYSQLSVIWNRIEQKFPRKIEETNDVDLLRFYFSESLTSFLEGNYERSFIWGYKVIREKTVVNPKDYVNDKRGASRTPFSEIRNRLEHSRREDEHIPVSSVRKLIKTLPNDCLDLLEREYEFITDIAKNSEDA